MKSKKTAFVRCPLCDYEHDCQDKREADRKWNSWRARAVRVASKLLRIYFRD